MTETKTTTPKKRASRAKPVPPAQFSAPEAEQPVRKRKSANPTLPPLPGQVPQGPNPNDPAYSLKARPGFNENGQRLYETVPEPATPRCVERGGCKEPATQQVTRRPHIRYCPRHGAEFEVRQQYVVDPWELEPIR